MEGYIYLIGEMDNEGKYKIGISRHENVEKRKNHLQTGNPDELYVRYKFKTNSPFKLEKMLHNHYYKDGIINEWFFLDEEKSHDFLNICKKYQDIIDSLDSNPFFKKG